MQLPNGLWMGMIFINRLLSVMVNFLTRHLIKISTPILQYREYQPG